MANKVELKRVSLAWFFYGILSGEDFLNDAFFDGFASVGARPTDEDVDAWQEIFVEFQTAVGTRYIASDILDFGNRDAVATTWGIVLPCKVGVKISEDASGTAQKFFLTKFYGVLAQNPRFVECWLTWKDLNKTRGDIYEKTLTNSTFEPSRDRTYTDEFVPTGATSNARVNGRRTEHEQGADKTSGGTERKLSLSERAQMLMTYYGEESPFEKLMRDFQNILDYADDDEVTRILNEYYEGGGV